MKFWLLGFCVCVPRIVDASVQCSTSSCHFNINLLNDVCALLWFSAPNSYNTRLWLMCGSSSFLSYNAHSDSSSTITNFFSIQFTRWFHSQNQRKGNNDTYKIKMRWYRSMPHILFLHLFLPSPSIPSGTDSFSQRAHTLTHFSVLYRCLFIDFY